MIPLFDVRLAQPTALGERPSTHGCGGAKRLIASLERPAPCKPATRIQSPTENGRSRLAHETAMKGKSMATCVTLGATVRSITA
jgi:hypothetical protein